MAGETNIGGIVGFLRLEADQFHREIQQALLETDSLNGKHVKVNVDTGSLDRVPTSSRNAAAGMDEAVKSSRRLEDATNRVRLAELKLIEANDSGKASKIFAAQTELTRARRGEIDAVWGTYDANIGLTQAQDKVVGSGEKVAETHKKSAKAASENRQQVGALATALITLGPAIVPLAAGAVGLGAAFGGMGAAGIAAFMGIKREMAANTPVGEGYQKTIDSARVGLERLASTAAGNVLGSFQSAVADLNAAMPTLTGQISDLSIVTGKAGAAVVSGVVTAFQALNPLMLDASIYILDLTQRFQAAAGGSGMTEFVDYVRSSFPQVMQDVESIVTAVGKLVGAFAPLGLGTLSTLKVFSDLISAIPTAALSEIATLAASVFIGFRAWQALSAPINGLTKMLGGVEEMSTRAAGAMRGLQASAGLIGVALAGLSMIMSANAESTRESQQATDDLTDALIRSNGAINDEVKLKALQHAQDSGAIDNAAKLGIGAKQVTDAYLGQAGALGDLSAQRDAALAKQKALVDAGKADASTMTDVETAYVNLKNELARAGIEWDGTKVKIQQHNDVLGVTAGVTSGAAQAAQDLADKYGLSVTVYDQVVAGQKAIADQAEIATAKMQAQNDAAGLLKDALDRLNGKALSNEEAKNAYDRAGNALASPIDAAKAKIAAAEKAQAAAAAAVSGAQGKSGSVASNGGHVSSGAANALARAQLAATQAQEHLSAVQSNGKATANQLESAQNRVETSSLRLAQAQAKAGTATGGSTQAQKDAAAKAVGHAQAQKAQADAAVAAAKADLIAQRALDGSSEAAVRNRDNIINMVKAAETASGTNGDLANSSEAARQKFIQMREDVITQAGAQGLNTDKVREYLDTIAAVPDHVEPTKFDADTKPGTGKAKEWVGVINGVPTWKEVTFKAKTADALAAVATVRDAIAGVRDKTVTISAVFSALGQEAALQAHNAQTLDRHGIVNANGSIRLNGVQKMAQGGFSGRESTIMRSTNPILWNEAPGGEAYISLAPEKRARSLAIHSQVGALLGANGGGGGRMHPDDIGMLARALGREISRIPTPQMGINQLDAARGGY